MCCRIVSKLACERFMSTSIARTLKEYLKERSSSVKADEEPQEGTMQTGIEALFVFIATINLL